jgi:hypothetical protein
MLRQAFMSLMLRPLLGFFYSSSLLLCFASSRFPLSFLVSIINIITDSAYPLFFQRRILLCVCTGTTTGPYTRTLPRAHRARLGSLGHQQLPAASDVGRKGRTCTGHFKF